MNKNDLPFIVDLKDKVVVITGAGGVICSSLAQSISQCGAKVALLDLHLDSAQKYADEINANGGIAKAFEANVLKKDSLIKCHQEVLKEFGKCDILINGAGGNNPLATTDNEFAELDDNLKDMKTFFKLDESGVEFVFNATPIGRFGEVNELVGATLFLIDNKAASFITGICVPIDGGFSSYSGV